MDEYPLSGCFVLKDVREKVKQEAKIKAVGVLVNCNKIENGNAFWVES